MGRLLCILFGFIPDFKLPVMLKQVLFVFGFIFYSANFLFSQELPTLKEKNIFSSRVNKASFSGKITDLKTGEPLPGASISVADLKLGTIADAAGKFVFSEIPEGHHLIEVSHTGYATLAVHMDISGLTVKDFALSPSIIENQVVIVTGVANATSMKKAPVSVISMKRAELMESAATNIIDILARKPGISQVGTGPGISKPVIRGLGYNRVLVINEGVRQEGQQWGDEHGIEIDEYSVGRVEILKGPASLMYGSDALAGVINFVSNVPVQEGTIRGNVLSGFQSNNQLWGGYANVAGNKRNMNWNIYGTLKTAGNYQNRYDGKVLNSSYNEKNFGGYIGINKKWGFSHLVFSSFNQHTGLVEGERDDSSGRFLLYAGSPLERLATPEDLEKRNPLIPRQHIQHYKIASDNNVTVGKSRLKVNVGFQQNLRKEFGNPEDEKDAALIFDLKTITYNVQWVLPEKKEWHITVGGNGMYQQNKNKGEEAIIPDYHFVDAGAFMYTQRYFNKATLSGGLRMDNRTIHSLPMTEGTMIRFEKFNKSFSNISGSVGISYEPSGVFTLKANIARGFRAPSLAELASHGAHEGTNRYEYGNRNLHSETSLQLDGGLLAANEHFSAGLSVFYSRINNFIFYRKLSSTAGGDSLVNVNGEDLIGFQFDQYDATLTGMELNIDIHPHPVHWLHFENSFSFVRGRFDELTGGTNNLPLIPAPRIVSELKAEINKAGKSLRNMYMKVEADHNFRQQKPYFAYHTETATPGYTLVNAGLGSEIVNKKEKVICTVHFAAINLADVAYQNHLSRLKYTDVNNLSRRIGVFNMGRNFSLKINVPLYISDKKS